MKPWDINQVSQYLGRSPGAVRNMVMRRAIPYRKLCGRLIFLEPEIQKWIEAAPGMSFEDLTKRNESRVLKL